MKFVIFNASPTKKGVGAQMSQLAKRIVKKQHAGVTIAHYNLSEVELFHCKGVASCFKNGYCPLQRKDQFEIESIFKDADAIVLFSPVYAHQVPGIFKTFLDRISYLMHDMPLIGKKVILTAYSVSNGAHDLAKYLQELVESMGGENCGTFYFHTAMDDSSLFEKSLGTAICHMMEKIEQRKYRVTKNQDQLFQHIKSIVAQEKAIDITTYKHKRWNKLAEYTDLMKYLNTVK